MSSDTCPNDLSQAISSWSAWALPPIHTDSHSVTREVHLRGSIISTPVGFGMKLHSDLRHGWIVSCEQLVVTFRLTSTHVTVADLHRWGCQMFNAVRSLENSSVRSS